MKLSPHPTKMLVSPLTQLHKYPKCFFLFCFVLFLFSTKGFLENKSCLNILLKMSSVCQFCTKDYVAFIQMRSSRI